MVSYLYTPHIPFQSLTISALAGKVKNNKDNNNNFFMFIFLCLYTFVILSEAKESIYLVLCFCYGCSRKLRLLSMTQTVGLFLFALIPERKFSPLGGSSRSRRGLLCHPEYRPTKNVVDLDVGTAVVRTARRTLRRRTDVVAEHQSGRRTVFIGYI